MAGGRSGITAAGSLVGNKLPAGGHGSVAALELGADLKAVPYCGVPAGVDC